MGRQQRQIDWPEPGRITKIGRAGMRMVSNVADQEEDRTDHSANHALRMRGLLLAADEDKAGDQQNSAGAIQSRVDRRQVG